MRYNRKTILGHSRSIEVLANTLSNLLLRGKLFAVAWVGPAGACCKVECGLICGKEATETMSANAKSIDGIE